MAQRVSGYARRENELYETREPWVVGALAEHVRLAGLTVLEPCAGSGLMAAQLSSHGATVWQSDLVPDPQAKVFSRTQAVDFLTMSRPPGGTDAIISNPPWGAGGRTAAAFAAKGLEFMRAPGSRIRLLALLLSVDFDSASGRTALFADCPEFTAKIVFLKRIRWFDGPSGPSTNHAFFLWTRPDVAGGSLPRLLYAPRAAAAVGLGDL